MLNILKKYVDILIILLVIIFNFFVIVIFQLNLTDGLHHVHLIDTFTNLNNIINRIVNIFYIAILVDTFFIFYYLIKYKKVLKKLKSLENQ
jgi:hypothetical protein